MASKDYGSWEAAQAAARSGEADVIFGIYKTDARARDLDFIEPPFMTDPVAIVVRKGAGFAYAGWSDLKTRKGVTNVGESYGDTFDAFMAKELTVARAEGVDKAFAALLAGQADYMIIGLYPGRDEAKRLRIADKLSFLPKELLSSAMYVAFSKKSKCGAALQAGFAADIKAPPQRQGPAIAESGGQEPEAIGARRSGGPFASARRVVSHGAGALHALNGLTPISLRSSGYACLMTSRFSEVHSAASILFFPPARAAFRPNTGARNCPCSSPSP